MNKFLEKLENDNALRLPFHFIDHNKSLDPDKYEVDLPMYVAIPIKKGYVISRKTPENRVIGETKKAVYQAVKSNSGRNIYYDKLFIDKKLLNDPEISKILLIVKYPEKERIVNGVKIQLESADEECEIPIPPPKNGTL